MLGEIIDQFGDAYGGNHDPIPAQYFMACADIFMRLEQPDLAVALAATATRCVSSYTDGQYAGMMRHAFGLVKTTLGKWGTDNPVLTCNALNGLTVIAESVKNMKRAPSADKIADLWQNAAARLLAAGETSLVEEAIDNAECSNSPQIQERAAALSARVLFEKIRLNPAVKAAD